MGPVVTDRRTIQLVIGGLVIITVALLAAATAIAIHDAPKDVPDAMWTLLGTAVGALAAMLARTSSDTPPPSGP